MPTLDRIVHRFTLDLLRPTLNRLQIVNGDTAHTFEVTLKFGGVALTLDQNLHKVLAVFERADGEVYVQDASGDVSFTAAGVVTIDVHSTSFRTGSNTLKIQIYKRENQNDEEYPLLLTTYEQRFTARAEAIPEAGAPNAPSQLPMLEQLISDAEAATDAANEAAAAALKACQIFSVHVLTNISWDGSNFYGYADEGGDDITAAYEAGKLFVVEFVDPDGNLRTVYEAYRNEYDVVHCVADGWHAEIGVGGASVQVSGGVDDDPVAASASVSNGTVTFANAANETLFSFALPLYDGGVSDDE